METREEEGQNDPLPTLDIEYLPEMRQKPQPYKKKKGRQFENEILTYITSAFYSKILVIIGIGFSITRSLTIKGSLQHDIYFIYLYTGSFAFLLYMYIIHHRAKSILYEINNGQYSDRSGFMANDKIKMYTRYGSFYFRMGVVGFGIGSLIFSSLQFGQYFEFKKGCVSLLRAIKPATRISFILLQMHFIFSFSNFLDVQKSKLIAKFGLMHLVATNLSDWFQVLIESTVHDLYYSIQSSMNYHKNLTFLETQRNIYEITKYQTEKKTSCLRMNLISPILVRVEPHLGTCAVEYNILCTMILLLMWKNSTSHEELEASRDLSTEISRQSDSNVIYGRSQSQFSVDCAQTQRGLFSGILLLAVTIISLIMFFELIQYDDQREVALLEVNIWEAVLFITATLAVIQCFISFRDLKISYHGKEMKIEHRLLVITQVGIFMYFFFQVIGGSLMQTHTGVEGIMRIITPLSALIQSTCQTTFILDAWRRRCLTEQQMKRKPGRQLITFMLLINISLWVVNRVKNNRSAFHPNQMDFYGILAWNIITHVSMPLVVSYRFQASVCFYEIWKHVYKRPIKPMGLSEHQSEVHD